MYPNVHTLAPESTCIGTALNTVCILFGDMGPEGKPYDLPEDFWLGAGARLDSCSVFMMPGNPNPKLPIIIQPESSPKP